MHRCASLVWLQDQRRQNVVPLRVSSLGARETEGGSGESRGNLFTVLRLNPNHLTIAWLTATLFNVIESIDCSIAHLRLLCSRVRDAQSQAALSKEISSSALIIQSIISVGTAALWQGSVRLLRFTLNFFISVLLWPPGKECAESTWLCRVVNAVTQLTLRFTDTLGASVCVHPAMKRRHYCCHLQEWQSASLNWWGELPSASWTCRSCSSIMSVFTQILF